MVFDYGRERQSAGAMPANEQSREGPQLRGEKERKTSVIQVR